MMLTEISVAASLKKAGFKRVISFGDNLAEILPGKKTVGVTVSVDPKAGLFTAVLLNEWDCFDEVYSSSSNLEDSIESSDWMDIIKWILIRYKKM